MWLRDRSPVPIAAGENESGRHEFQPWIDNHALASPTHPMATRMPVVLPVHLGTSDRGDACPQDFFQVDLGKCGITDGIAIRKRVEDAGHIIINHCYKTPISIAACLHWLSTAPSAVIFEDCVEESPLRNELVDQRVQAGADGWIAAPEGPGLGITINEEVVKSLLVAESGWS